MPPEKITLVKSTDITKLMKPGPDRLQSLQGFDADYTDIVNYIVACTHKIWEEGGIGLIYTHYLHNVKVHTGDGWILGRDAMVADTLHTLSAFQDRRAFAESVVWTGNDQDGFYTNHIALSLQHNTGYSKFGPPTGRKVMRFAQCICYVKDNFICEEWVLNDEIGVIRQLGLNLDEMVARFAQRDAVLPPQNYGDTEHRLGQYAPEPYPQKAPSGAGFDVDDFLRRNLHEIWNRRMFNVLRDVVHENCLFHGPAQRELYGRGDYTAFVLSLLAAFPDARFAIDQLFWNEEAPGVYRTSMRWSLVGTHAGDGIFGAPTGAPVRVWGLTQHLIRAGRIVDEWTFINELALLKQFYRARRGPAAPA